MNNIRVAGVTLAACLTAGTSTHAPAQAPYPAQPIKFIVPFPPAGGTDLVSRLIAEKISAAGGWTFVIDNRPGAGGNVGLEVVAKAKADGYTAGMGQTSNMAINPALYSKMPFNPQTDLIPVSLVAEQPVVLVVKADAPWKNLADLLAAAKAKNGSMTMSSPGNGTAGHIAGEMLARRAGVRITHVPYKGASEKALGQRDTVAKLLEEGSAPLGGPPERALQFIKGEQAKWGSAVRAAGVKLD